MEEHPLVALVVIFLGQFSSSVTVSFPQLTVPEMSGILTVSHCNHNIHLINKNVMNKKIYNCITNR